MSVSTARGLSATGILQRLARPGGQKVYPAGLNSTCVEHVLASTVIPRALKYVQRTWHPAQPSQLYQCARERKRCDRSAFFCSHSRVSWAIVSIRSDSSCAASADRHVTRLSRLRSRKRKVTEQVGRSAAFAPLSGLASRACNDRHAIAHHNRLARHVTRSSVSAEAPLCRATPPSCEDRQRPAHRRSALCSRPRAARDCARAAFDGGDQRSR